MTIDDKFKDEKLQYDINKEEAKKQHYRQVKLRNMNILQVKKYQYLFKFRLQNNLCLIILLQEKLQIKINKNNQRSRKKTRRSLKIYKELPTVINQNEIEKRVDRGNLIYKTDKYTYNFRQFQALKFVFVKLLYMTLIQTDLIRQ